MYYSHALPVWKKGCLTSKNSDIIASMPTRARMTVRRGAAGNVIFVFNSSI